MLIKETLLEVYILKFKTISVIHLQETDFQYLLDTFSSTTPTHTYYVYTTLSQDLTTKRMVTMYHLFSNKGDLKEFECDHKYTCMEILYDSFIIVNKRFDV